MCARGGTIRTHHAVVRQFLSFKEKQRGKHSAHQFQELHALPHTVNGINSAPVEIQKLYEKIREYLYHGPTPLNVTIHPLRKIVVLIQRVGLKHALKLKESHLPTIDFQHL